MASSNRTQRYRNAIHRGLEQAGIERERILWLSKLNQRELLDAKRVFSQLYTAGQNRVYAQLDIEDDTRDRLIDDLVARIDELDPDRKEDPDQ